jgi:hypothetical protein
MAALLLSVSRVLGVTPTPTATPCAVEDSYSESNRDSDGDLVTGVDDVYGQSFTASFTGNLSRAAFYLKKSGSPTGNMIARLYEHTGTYGINSLPGASLAISDSIDVSTLTTSSVVTYFTFSVGNQYTLVSGTHYIITVELSPSGLGNHLFVGRDTTGTHDGNTVEHRIGFGWNAIGIDDTIFYVEACLASPTPTPTATATFTPTPTPTATFTPTPTATATSTSTPTPTITPNEISYGYGD